MLGRFFESLYHKVFVNIVVGNTKSTVYIESCKKDTVINSDQKSFTSTTLNSEMQEFISTYISETPYYYISVLDNSDLQGAVPTCKKSELSVFYEPSDAKSICFHNKWTYYTSKADILAIQNSYKGVGIDFLFSPFILLNSFFKDKIDTHNAMFILLEEESISLAVFDKSVLLYAEHLSMEDYDNDIDDEELLIEDHDEIDLDLDSITNLDELDTLDEMDSLDDFGDIEDLDSIEDIDEFSESKDLDEELTQESEEEYSSEEAEDFNRDYQRFLLIQGSINSFYKDKKFKSSFIETAYIADSVGVSSDLKRYLEEEMFLSTYIRHIDLATQLCEIAKMEVE